MSDHVSRRRFLRLAALGGLAGVFGWRFLIPARGARYPGLVLLGQTDARILAAAFEAITGRGEPAELASAVRFFDGYLAHCDPRDLRELRVALRLLEHSPLFTRGYPGRFTALTPTQRAACLEAWRTGPSWGRPIFGALKELSYLRLYSRPASWATIGYAGPMAGDGISAFDARYAGLVAPRGARL